jgi:hypothetical protein
MPDPTGQRASRTWDGSPETDRDRRFFDLRAAGYRGPIDQDGYAVDDDPGDYAIGCPNGCDPTFGHRASCSAGRLL